MSNNCNHRWSEIVDLRDEDAEHYRECVDCGVTAPTAVIKESSSSISSGNSTSSYDGIDSSVEISSNVNSMEHLLDKHSKSIQLSEK
jgi:CO dehydrogenase/acetyl-CoA synthase beta subunit